MASTTELLMIGVIISILVLAVIVLLATRNKRQTKLGLDTLPDAKKEPETTASVESKETPIETNTASPTIYSSVTRDDVQKAEEDLRILSVEREIVSYALTRLFEAQAEGKITEKDKDKLLGKYKVEMSALEKQMNDKQMVVKLHELESTQADLIKLFQDKFEEINRNIETIRTNLGLQTQPAVTPPPSTAQVKETSEPKAEQTAQEAEDKTNDEKTQGDKEKSPPKPKTPAKSKAEEKVEVIQQEVLKILERLEKQDVEG
jgi:hypothetical protein